MPVLSALSPALCAADAKRFELGAAVLIFSKKCVASGTTEPDIILIPSGLRDGTTVTATPQFLNIQNQASVIGTDREQGKNVGFSTSLGADATNIEKLGLLFDTEIITDGTNPNTKSIDFSDAPGRIPTHYQVAIIPVKEGTKLDYTMGWIFYHAYAKPENSQFVFDVNTAVNVGFSFMTDPDPANQKRATFYRSADGTSDVAQLRAAASEYLAIYPE